MPNRLALSSSPYLRQHAENPIDWFPWGEEAFEKALAEGKPVLLSVGYSSCHWCHVMAHESFEDVGVAAILNEQFVCIKVDREERPDVDDTYMTAVQLSSGRGGWPMTLFLTPEKKPFFAGTYLPKEDRHGQPGFVSVINGIAEGWRTSRREFEEAADEFARALTETIERALPPAAELPREEQLLACLNALAHDFDPHNGGFGGAPKFPPHTAIEFLLKLGTSNVLTPQHRERALEMADGTLLSMALGGIRDHVGGGFHRYSTDAHWLLPHFEKMLVDNALMLANYATGFRVLGRPLYKEVADEIVEWLEREMRGPDGLYFSALDADSALTAGGAKEEGRFYVWTWDEVRSLLGERAVPFMEAYGFARNGNFDDEATSRRTGANIPHLGEERRHESSDGYEADLRVLREAREARPRPGLDDKALVGQNGLLIAGFVAAGRIDLASRTAESLMRFAAIEVGHMKLPRQVVQGRAQGHGFLDDYAAFAFGLRMLAEVFAGRGDEPFDPRCLWQSEHESACRGLNRFATEDGRFLASSPEHEELFGRPMPIFDNPTPSAVALALRATRWGSVADWGMHLIDTALRLLGPWMERAPTSTEALHTALIEDLLERPDDELFGFWGLTDGPHRDRRTPVWVWVQYGNGDTGELVMEIEKGWHVTGPDPADSWAEPMKVWGAQPQYPPTTNGRYEGTIKIPYVIDDASTHIAIRWQACSDDLCRQPLVKTFPVRLQAESS